MRRFIGSVFAMGLWAMPVSAQVEEAWVARYDGSVGKDDRATTLVIDSSENVYVTGGSMGSRDATEDYATVKYNHRGTQCWVARYDGGESFHDRPLDIAVDAEGHVFVTGGSMAPGGEDRDYATVKYDRDGNELWNARYDGPGDRDEARSIALDFRREASPDARGRTTAVVFTGNVFVTGFIGSRTETTCATLKYDCDGNLIWVREYDDPESARDFGWHVAVDSEGSIYVTGLSQVNLGTNFFTVKYDGLGRLLWLARSAAGTSNRHPHMALDRDGNVYIAGVLNDEWRLWKIDSFGNEIWTESFRGEWRSFVRSPQALVVDVEANVYVSGTHTLKYSVNGQQLWAQPFELNFSEGSRAMAVDREGGVYVVGPVRMPGNPDQSDYVTVKYDSSGMEEWVVTPDYSPPARLR